MSNSTTSDHQSQEQTLRILELETKNSKEIKQEEVIELATLKCWSKVNGFNISPVAMHLDIDWDTRVLHGIISSLCYNTGFFYGSIKWLMYQTGFKVMHIQRRLKIMKDAGLIRIEGKSPDWKIYDKAHNYTLIEKQKLSTDKGDSSVSPDAPKPPSISTDAPSISADAPSISTDASPPYTFSNIERVKESTHTNSKYLYEKTVQILSPQERIDDGFDLVGSEKKIKHAIAAIGLSDLPAGKEQADKILGKLDLHLAIHKRNKAETGKSKFSNIANWFATQGWLKTEFEKVNSDKSTSDTQSDGSHNKTARAAPMTESKQAERYAFANTPEFEKMNHNALHASQSEINRLEFMKKNAPKQYRAELERLNKSGAGV